ncbi:transmembrane protein, putative [Medicago truncatula]|uniref:Transmembrane protein, putative n=1 Tax=Medicago truncatula TaxID=3880 RepID=G7KWE4_MEDTR|nr:transmembrane protein, putative [Medicago truncatula]
MSPLYHKQPAVSGAATIAFLSFISGLYHCFPLTAAIRKISGEVFLKKPTSKEAEPSSQLDAKVPSPESCTFTRHHSCTSSLVREKTKNVLEIHVQKIISDNDQNE